MIEIKDREELYNYFDKYTLQRKEELNQRALQAGSGLLKAYAIELLRNGENISAIFEKSNWQLKPVDDSLYQVTGLPDKMDGFIEEWNHRYAIFYTTATTEICDPTVRGLIRRSSKLDHVWLSSPLLNLIWQDLIGHTQRHAVLRYEIEPHFERTYSDTYTESFLDDEDDGNNEGDAGASRPPKARLTVKRDVYWLRENFGRDKPAAKLFGNLTRVRVPKEERGRHEYYYDGKVTNRGNEFRGFAAELRNFVINVYGTATNLIEETAALNIKSNTVTSDFTRMDIRGAPITFIFNETLRKSIFERFINQTFVKGVGPFKLWGNPIQLSGSRVHIYGLDLHLWQQVFLDMSPDRFILIIPKETCGNTVHRLTANIQRYLDPAVEVYVGSENYEDLVQRALRHNE